ncbi:MAG: type IV secretory system conjugative DNA transfer family protein [Candidatus Paceibacterota bacterium]
MEKYNQNSFNSPEDEINFLREQIAQKEKELSEKNYSVDKKLVVQEQISKYKNTLSEEVLDKDYKISEDDLESFKLKLSPDHHDKKIKELVGIMNEKGIHNALSVLSGLKDPHLEDDFHRFLVQYFSDDRKVKGLKSKEGLSRGIGMKLYEFVLPDEEEGEKTKTLKEIISGMEQFYSGMLSIYSKKSQSHIVIEIANANDSDQFVFYVAVPKEHTDLFEKQIISIFHNARLTEVVDDYNIFNEDGISLGSYAELKESPVYPIKTYENFDHDPMNVILNSFSKIEKEGEGAALQIVLAPQGDYFNDKYSFAIDQIEKGADVKKAVSMKESFAGDLGKVLKDLFKAPKEEEKKEIDTNAIEKIKRKISAPILATNIRIIASSRNRLGAEKILKEIESSFNQFTDTNSNAIKWQRPEKKPLQRLFRDFSFRLYNPTQLVPLNIHEINTISHFHTTRLSPNPQLRKTQYAEVPPPSEISSAGTLLGINSYRNTDTKINILDEDRLRHFYTIGQTGTGKSTLLKNMIIQDIKNGHGVCMIDPHGIDMMDIMANIPKDRFNDVIYFDPSYIERPMALNMLEYDPRFPEQKTFVVNELFSIFQKLYGGAPESMGPMFEQYFRNATMLVIEDPETGSTLLDVSRVMSDKTFRDLKISRCKNPVVVEFWKEVAEKAGGEATLANIVPYITSKFDVFLANEIMRPIIAQEKSSFNFRDIMDNRKILLVNLSKGRLGDINANLIGLILVGKILMSALSRADIIGKDFPPFYLYIDEFQNVTTNSISTILSEARKYKLSLNIAHQFIAQLEEGIRDAVFGNVGSIVSFRVGAEDAEYLEKQFAPVFTARDIMNIDNRNAYVKMLIAGRPAKAFNMKTLPPPEGNPSIVGALKQLSYFSYGGNKEEIEADILKKYKKR